MAFQSILTSLAPGTIPAVFRFRAWWTKRPKAGYVAMNGVLIAAVRPTNLIAGVKSSLTAGPDAPGTAGHVRSGAAGMPSRALWRCGHRDPGLRWPLDRILHEPIRESDGPEVALALVRDRLPPTAQSEPAGGVAECDDLDHLATADLDGLPLKVSSNRCN